LDAFSARIDAGTSCRILRRIRGRAREHGTEERVLVLVFDHGSLVTETGLQAKQALREVVGDLPLSDSADTGQKEDGRNPFRGDPLLHDAVERPSMMGQKG
jgi:hypothetical protein